MNGISGQYEIFVLPALTMPGNIEVCPKNKIYVDFLDSLGPKQKFIHANVKVKQRPIIRGL